MSYNAHALDRGESSDFAAMSATIAKGKAKRLKTSGGDFDSLEFEGYSD